ncbi:hypothetical protein CC78DRAFT_474680, partial [Lojkania enalia]
LMLKFEIISEVVTRSIFSWLRVDNWPKAKREIYTYEWLDFGASNQESDGGTISGGGCKGANKRVKD